MSSKSKTQQEYFEDAISSYLIPQTPIRNASHRQQLDSKQNCTAKANSHLHYDEIFEEFELKRNRDHEIFIEELQNYIFAEVKSMEDKEHQGNPVMLNLTVDLQEEIESMQERIRQIKNQLEVQGTSSHNDRLPESQKAIQGMTEQSKEQSALQKTNIYMHIQAVSKILVFIHGKSDFRLVYSHYHLGESYLEQKCYEQSIDHFTIALKKNSKITEVKETKIYHSYLLTSLSKCYIELKQYDDALDILNRAIEIQQCYVNTSELKINNIMTMTMISECHLLMENYKYALDFLDKILGLLQKLKGTDSQEYLYAKYQKAKINCQEGNILTAIEEQKSAIDCLKVSQKVHQKEKNSLLLIFYQQQAEFQEKFQDFEQELACYREMEQIMHQNQPSRQNYVNILHLKQKMAVVSIKHSNIRSTVSDLKGIIDLEIQLYTETSVEVSKSLKILGLVHLQLGEEHLAEQYLKKSYQISTKISSEKSVPHQSKHHLPGKMLNQIEGYQSKQEQQKFIEEQRKQRSQIKAIYKMVRERRKENQCNEM